MSKYSNINTSVTLFNNLFLAEKDKRQSGKNEKDWLDDAHRQYQAVQRSKLKGRTGSACDFKYEQVWNLVRHAPRWSHVTSNDMTQIFPAKKCRSPQIETDDKESIFSTGSEDRPLGIKRAKREAKEDRQVENAATMHAEATADLARTMRRRNELMEQAADRELLTADIRSLTPTAAKLIEKLQLQLEKKWTSDGTLCASDD